MPNNDIAVSIRGLSKSYSIAHNAPGHSTLGEALLQRLRSPFRKQTIETFWALQDINLTVNKGEVVGIIGRNGAGKSTLLKVLSSITEPTKGEIDLYGRIGSLLEVGTGFHPELTGRENIFLNGAILGMRRAEISRSFDAIVDFAGVERFLDTPVKRYSSGMYVRLAFAVAAHLNPEILIVDEVLAVGDAEFQNKCLGKMQDVAKGGRTVFVVSHQMQTIAMLCTRGVVLKKGKMTYDGAVSGAVAEYIRSTEDDTEELYEPSIRPGSGEYRFTSVSSAKQFFTAGEEKVIRFSIKRFKPGSAKFVVSCHILDNQGAILLQCDSQMVGHWIEAGDTYHGELTITTPWLKPGKYRVDMYICSSGMLDRFEHACRIHVAPSIPYAFTGEPGAIANGVVFADFNYREVKSPIPAQREPTEEMGRMAVSVDV